MAAKHVIEKLIPKSMMSLAYSHGKTVAMFDAENIGSLW